MCIRDRLITFNIEKVLNIKKRKKDVYKRQVDVVSANDNDLLYITKLSSLHFVHLLMLNIHPIERCC